MTAAKDVKILQLNDVTQSFYDDTYVDFICTSNNKLTFWMFEYLFKSFTI